MTHRLLVFVATLAIAACGGGQSTGPAAAAAGDAPGGETPGAETSEASSATPARASEAEGAASSESGDTAREPSGDNEFALEKSDAASRGRGVKASQIKATETEAAVRFTVIDKDKGPVGGVVISLTAPDGTKFYTQETDAKGFAEVLVPKGQKYDLVYLSLGPREVSAKVEVPDRRKQNVNLTLRYKRHRPEGGEPQRFVLGGVEFDTNKAKIREESFERLDSIVEFMTHKKSARIEISGHTDNVGRPKRNQALSENRAKAVRQYLVSRGIDKGRIDAVGYGDARPVASNDTDAGRQENRRIEVTEL